MSLSIREIDLKNKKDINAFINLAWDIYKDDPHWVPPLKMAVKDLLNQKHPFYKTADVKAWIASIDGKVVGRIMAIHNHTYNKFEKNKIGHFGFFETINDEKVAKILIETAAAHLKKLGLTSMQGPMNHGTNYECGLLVDKFDDAPQVMMTYNPPYYETLLASLGFTKAMDLLAYNMKPEVEMPKVVMDIAARTEKKSKVTYRNLNLKNWTKELDTMFEIYNSAWEENWGFVPMSKEEFYHTAKDLKSIADPTLIQYAMVDGKEAGFILALPDLNQVFKQIPSGNLSPMAIFKILTAKSRINRARVVMMGLKKEYRKMGLETLLYKNIQIMVQKNPRIKNVEMSWILETNVEMNKPLIRMSGPAYKRYRLVEKAI
jgi:argonaute-like protein implicated in RNA metabolism and viral defense